METDKILYSTRWKSNHYLSDAFWTCLPLILMLMFWRKVWHEQGQSITDAELWVPIAAALYLLGFLLWSVWKHRVCETNVIARLQTREIAIEKRQFSRVVDEQSWPAAVVKRLGLDPNFQVNTCYLELKDETKVPFDKEPRTSWVFARLLEANMQLDQYKLTIGCMDEQNIPPIRITSTGRSPARWLNRETLLTFVAFVVVLAILLLSILDLHNLPEQTWMIVLILFLLICIAGIAVHKAIELRNESWSQVLLEPANMQIALERNEDNSPSRRETHRLADILNFEYSQTLGFQMLMRDGSRVMLQKTLDAKGADELRNACNEILEAYKNCESAKNVKPFNRPADSQPNQKD